ncbi:hypothetical protein CRUP_009010, partial [Coryphaenoides rupestris]
MNKGTSVGNLAKDLKLNLNDLEPRDLRIVSGYTKRYFNVDLRTGHLIVADRIDREELCNELDKYRPLDREAATEYNVTISSRDGGDPPLSTSSYLMVYVSDVNDNAPHFADPVFNVYVKENSGVGTVVYRVNAMDSDSDDNARITYSLLSSSSQNIAVLSAVNINSETGDI